MPPKQILLAASLTAITCAVAPALAQAPATPAPQVRAAMSKLAWLEGTWEGEGWRSGTNGVEHFQARETVEAKLGGLIYVIEGIGWNDDHGARHIGHNAIGVLSYDAFKKTYNFDAFTFEGFQTRSQPVISDNAYSWSFAAGPGTEMRYTAQLTNDGAWLETGSYCKDDNCRQTFEMRLERLP